MPRIFMAKEGQCSGIWVLGGVEFSKKRLSSDGGLLPQPTRGPFPVVGVGGVGTVWAGEEKDCYPLVSSSAITDQDQERQRDEQGLGDRLAARLAVSDPMQIVNNL